MAESTQHGPTPSARDIDAAFLEVLEDEDTGGALARLDERDPRLADAVRELLAFDEEPTSFDHLTPTRPSTGERFGDWELVGVLGQGGMGTVFEARRTVANTVQRGALKIATVAWLGSVTQQRFERERRLLARASGHPNLAAFLDAGAGPRGELYVVTELVEGEELLDAAESRGLDRRARVEVLRHLTSAVEHLHRRGLIHRDIKPSNVLLDESGAPRLVDPGIARDVLAGESGASGTQSMFIMTPAWAAPEPLLGAEITTVTHVYGLGRLGAARLGATPDLTLAPRDADLEAILARASREDPAERYASAAAFGEELSRWMQGEPVEARRGHRLYAMGHWAKRHRLLLMVVAASLTVAVSGILALSLDARARAERARAERSAKRAGDVADFVSGLLSGPVSSSQGRAGSGQRSVDRARELLATELVDQPELRAALYRAMASEFLEMGRVRECLEILDEAQNASSMIEDDHPERVRLLTVRARALGAHGPERDLPGALDTAREALRRARASSPEQAMASSALGDVERHSGRIEQAREAYLAALSLLERLGEPSHPASSDAHAGLGILPGDIDARRAHFRDALDASEEHLGALHLSRARLLAQLGTSEELAPADERLAYLLEAHDVTRESAPESARRAQLLSEIAVLQRDQRRFAEARVTLAESYDVIFRLLGREHPESIRIHIQSVWNYVDADILNIAAGALDFLVTAVPDDHDMRASHARLRMAKGEWEEAAKILESIEPGGPTFEEMLEDHVVHIAQELGQSRHKHASRAALLVLEQISSPRVSRA